MGKVDFSSEAEVRSAEGTGAMPVLVVADPTPSGDELARGLIDEGCTVGSAGSFEAALALVAELKPIIAVVEWCLTQGSGLQLLTEIRRLHPRTQVIVATAYGSINLAQVAIRSGALDYLTKPVTPRQILTLARAPVGEETTGWITLEDARRDYIRELLAQYGSVAKTARVLGLDRRSLRRMLSRFQLREGNHARSSVAVFGLEPQERAV